MGRLAPLSPRQGAPTDLEITVAAGKGTYNTFLAQQYRCGSRVPVTADHHSLLCFAD